MKQTINFSDFCDAFYNMGRADQYSYDAKRLIFDWFEQFDEDCGTETELDVIAICCDVYEDTWESIADNYSIDTSDCEDEDEAIAAVEEYLSENTTHIGNTDQTMVYFAF